MKIDVHVFLPTFKTHCGCSWTLIAEEENPIIGMPGIQASGSWNCFLQSGNEASSGLYSYAQFHTAIVCFVCFVLGTYKVGSYSTIAAIVINKKYTQLPRIVRIV